jgi:alcohol dehydrogenase
MQDFVFLSPTRLIVGKNAEKETGLWIKRSGGHKVLVHHDGGYTKKSGLVDRIIGYVQGEGLQVVELGGVVPNPRLSLVYKGIDLCREENVDFLLAIGGGSVIDSAKAIALGLTYDGELWDFFTEENGQAKAIPKKSTPIGVVLTIAATGSEASNSCVITKEDGWLKRFCNSDVNKPVFAIENPNLTMTLPKYQTACGIVDIMSHSMERYFTCDPENDVLTDHLAEAIMYTCMECGHVLMDEPDNYEARASLMVASTLSHNGLTGMGRTGDWASHHIEHELSGEFDVTHGAGLAVLTPAWMKYVYRCRPTIFIKWATRVMGVPYDYDKPERTILEGISRLEHFFLSLGLPVRMRDMPGVGDVDEAVMRKMAKKVRPVHPEGGVGFIKHLFTEDIVNIFKLAK